MSQTQHIIKGEFISFSRSQDNPKTQVWNVLSNDTWEVLGKVKWFGRWRKYAFFPNPETVYENVCLREITDFILKLTTEHKARR